MHATRGPQGVTETFGGGTSWIEVRLTAETADRTRLELAHTAPERLARVAKICGEDFAGHVLELKHDTESLRLSGWLALPTFSRSQADLQFAFLNGRFVRDKLLAGAVRLAYQDVLFHGRFPAYLLYLALNPTAVDVNTQPVFSVSGGSGTFGGCQRSGGTPVGTLSCVAPYTPSTVGSGWERRQG